MSSRIPTDVDEQVAELPVRNYVRLLRNRVAALRRRMPDTPAYYDQYPGKTVPRYWSKLYERIALTAAGRTGATGFLANAQLASTSNFLTPSGTNILTARTGTFYWHNVNIFAFLNWTYQADPGYAAPIDARPHGSLFDPAIEANGGGVGLLNYTNLGFSVEQPKICFEVELYDKRRGASLTDGRLPVEVFAGTTFGHKTLPKPVPFDADTEIEPRIYITEFRMGTALDEDTPYSAALVSGHINLVLGGVDVFEDFQTSELNNFAALPTPGGLISEE
jgi:hypothetical protein